MASTPPFPSRPGGNFGALQGGTLVFTPDNTQVLRVARDLLGRFTDMQNQARAAHQEMGIKAAETIADYLERQVRRTGRAQRPRGADSLRQLLRDPRIVDANSSGFLVGKQGFLESSPAAPYFRNLETGTRIFVGRELRGFFLSASGRASPPSGERLRRDPRLIQTNKFFAGKYNGSDSAKELKAQKERGDFRPGLQTYGRTMRRIKDKPLERNRTNGFKIIIKNPIPAYQYFFFGGQQYLLSGHVAATYRKHLKGVQIP